MPSGADRIAVLEQAIAASGLSTRRFAERVMVRDERTVRRWLAGTVPIPDVALRRLEEYVAEAKQKRRR